jgi:hypothetical protein
VIFVGKNSNYVKLHSSEANERAGYIALSYCWGGPQAITTTHSSLERNTKGLKLSSLPPTIRDAVLMVRRLGLEYLWVDALCIIQDSPEDKGREIDAMGRYYRNAFLTIAAASAAAVTEGFLRPRKFLPTCELPLFSPHGASITLSVGVRLLKARPKEPLYSRAWALQEFLLSPRLLIFGSREAVLQCQTTITSVLPSPISYDDSWPCERLPLNFGTFESRRTIWESIVSDYTSRQLALPGDRLPALGGIARELEVAWNDKYIAGMWQSELLVWLLWSSDCRVRPSGEPRAPSWSWAAVDGRITFRSFGNIEANAKVRYSDITDGGVKGQLCLSAVVMPLIMLFDAIKQSKVKTLRGASQQDHDIHGDFEDFDKDGVALQFILLGWRELVGVKTMSAFGLIVKPVEGQSQQFSRVGLVTRLYSSKHVFVGHEKEIITIV